MAGRNHHRIGLGSHSLTAMGFPGYKAFPPESGKSVAKHLQKAGFVNYAIGKWDHTPLYELSESGPFDHWPSGEGFNHYYGFMAADADNYRSLVWRDHYPTEDWEGKPGYHYSEAMADDAIRNITSHSSVSPDKPFMLFWAPVAMHSPHQAPPDYIEKYKGEFDMGWDEARNRIHKKTARNGRYSARNQTDGAHRRYSAVGLTQAGRAEALCPPDGSLRRHARTRGCPDRKNIGNIGAHRSTGQHPHFRNGR
jgi:arylsulfatase